MAPPHRDVVFHPYGKSCYAFHVCVVHKCLHLLQFVAPPKHEGFLRDLREFRLLKYLVELGSLT